MDKEVRIREIFGMKKEAGQPVPVNEDETLGQMIEKYYKLMYHTKEISRLTTGDPIIARFIQRAKSAMVEIEASLQDLLREQRER